MSSTENTSPPQAASPERDAQPPTPTPAAAAAGATAATAPPTETASRAPQPEASSPAHVNAESHGEDAGDDGGAHDGEHEGEREGGAGEAPGPDTAGGPRKRRRRRRKKGGAAGAAGAAPEGATDAVAAQAGPEGAGSADVTEAGDRPKGDCPPKPKKHDRKERPQDQRFPRERPAFGVGDVVFGKIIEITDDAVFVDLSGKARGIFDRHEMLLPDEPAEEPGAKEPDEDEDAGETDADEHASSESAEPESAEMALPHEQGVSAPAEPVAEGESAQIGAPANGEEAKADETSSAAAERRVAGRRIIVAAGVKAVDAESVVSPAETTGGPAVSAAVSSAESAPGAAPPPHGEAHAAPPAPRPAPYAPPIVLEVGAHFVGLVHNDGSRGGLIVLTRHPRRIRASKLATSAAFREKTLITGLVTGVVRGGVEVDVDGLRAFAPGSHLDLRPGADLRPLVGRRLDFLVTQYGKRGRDVVLSRRPMLESEAKAHRAEALERVQVGAVVPAVVKSVVSFGAFLDLGGVEGLVTLQEMSHNRGDAPHDVFRVGETVDVRIIRMDEKGKIWLSRKSAIPDPWDDAMKKYAVGTRHTGKIVGSSRSVRSSSSSPESMG